MKQKTLFLLVVCALLLPSAWATDYYLDATDGSDSANGQSEATAWKTLSKVGLSSFSGDDRILLQRAELWTEHLAVPSSGTDGHPITFDAYGSGPAPRISGKRIVTSAEWSLDGGSIWKASVTMSTPNIVVFRGSIQGNKRTGAKTDCIQDHDWYFASNVLYVYATSNPASYYGEAAVIVRPGLPLIDIINKNYLTLNHIRVDWYDGAAAWVRGTSQDITFNYCSFDAVLTQTTTPNGVYILDTATAVKFQHCDLHRNFQGVLLNNAAGTVTVTNCRLYGNRFYALTATAGTINYDYSHFFGNGISSGTGSEQPTSGAGATDGGHNIAAYVDPVVLGRTKYDARLGLHVDDIGVTAGADTYSTAVQDEMDKRGSYKLGISCVAAWCSGITATLQAWLARGMDILSHSWSHQTYDKLSAFAIQYVGAGSAATMTISGNALTTTCTGAAGDNLNIDLTNASYDTMLELVNYINGLAAYTCTIDANMSGYCHAVTLADVAAQDIRTAAYTALSDKSRLYSDEASTSKAWLEANVPGLTVTAYIYPSALNDSVTWPLIAAAGYTGAVGHASVQSFASEVFTKGANVQAMVMTVLSSWSGSSAAQIKARVAAQAFKAAVWGIPITFYVHKDQLTAAEMGYVLDGIIQYGRYTTASELAAYMATMYPTGTTYFKVADGAEESVDFRPNGESPGVNAATDLGLGLADLDGRVVPYGSAPDIGPYEWWANVGAWGRILRRVK